MFSKRHLGRVLALALIVLLALPAVPIRAAEEQKLIAITFDDGPSSYTTTLLDGLEERGAVATFFMCGVNGGNGVTSHKDTLKRMASLGCQLANHTYSHSSFSKLSRARMASEVESVEPYLFDAMGGYYLDVVRIPGGANNATIRSVVQHPIIVWSVDPQDWKDRNEDLVYQRIMNGAKDGSIILLHDLYLTSIKGGLRAISALQKQGYEFVTVSELFRRRGIDLQNGVTYSSAPNKGTNLPAYRAPVLKAEPDTASGSVRLTASAAESTILSIRYTTDGSDPTLASPACGKEALIAGSCTVRAAGFDRFGTRTPIAELKVNPGVGQPRIDSITGSAISLSCATPGAKIYYTMDGEDPRVAGTEYTGAFVPGSVTRAAARDENGQWSEVTEITKLSGSYFYDVRANDWFAPAVGEVSRHGLMSGVANYLFEPYSPASRAALVSILFRMEGGPDAGGTMPFQDVAADAWYAPAVQWASVNGIVQGKSENTFAPRDTVSRQQAATIAMRYAQSSGRAGVPGEGLEGYPDAAQVAPYAQEAMAWCFANGLLKEVNGNLAPEEPLLRGQCAVLMNGLLVMSANQNG